MGLGMPGAGSCIRRATFGQGRWHLLLGAAGRRVLPLRVGCAATGKQAKHHCSSFARPTMPDYSVPIRAVAGRKPIMLHVINASSVSDIQKYTRQCYVSY